jgi:hypothetical protein
VIACTLTNIIEYGTDWSEIKEKHHIAAATELPLTGRYGLSMREERMHSTRNALDVQRQRDMP